jgi:hypothetical protein
MQLVQAQVSQQVVLTNNRVIANQVQLDPGNLKLDIENALRPQGEKAASPQVATVLQRQLRSAIAGPGGRVDLQQVGKVVMEAAQREANALWGNAVAEGRIKLELREVTQFDHGVRVHFWLDEQYWADKRHTRTGHYHSGFDVTIKYDDKGFVTTESAIRRVWSHPKDVPFIQNINKALGVETPLEGPTPDLGFL